MPTMPMKPDVKALWLTALRSGEYEQTTGTLRGKLADSKDGFCCLGVLCDIAVRQGVIPEPRFVTKYEFSEPSYFYGKDEEDSNDAILPASVAEWAGLYSQYCEGAAVSPACSPEIDVAPDDERFGYDPDDEWACGTQELTDMNDTTDLGFKGIADYIEKYL